MPQWVSNSSGLQWPALLPPQPTASLLEMGGLNLSLLSQNEHSLRGASGHIPHGWQPVQCHGSVATSFPYPNGSPTALGCNGQPCFHLSQPLHCWSSGPQILASAKTTQSQRRFWPNMTCMAASMVPWEGCHILSIPQWVSKSSGLQWLAPYFHLSQPLHCWSSGPQILVA